MNNPCLYDQAHNSFIRRITAEVLSEFTPRLRWSGGSEGEGEAVLDVGSGPGTVTASLLLPLLPPRVRRVVGADLSPEMVRYARDAHAHADPRLRFVQADIAAANIDASPLRAEAGARGFSKIFSFFCLQLVQDHRTALTNMRQLLQPKGEALLVFPAKSPIYASFESISKQSKWKPYLIDESGFVCRYQHAADPGREFSRLLSEVGFHAIDCRWIHKTSVFENEEILKGFVTSINPFISKIPELEKDQFVTDCVQEILRQDEVTVTKDFIITCNYSNLIAFVEKND